MIFMVLSSWRSTIARVHPVHMMNADSVLGGLHIVTNQFVIPIIWPPHLSAKATQC